MRSSKTIRRPIGTPPRRDPLRTSSTSTGGSGPSRAARSTSRRSTRRGEFRLGRPRPHRDEVVFDEVFENDPQADWYATEAESAEDVLDLYRRVWAFADETFDSLPLDSPGKVPHWPAPMNAVTLGQIMVHVLVDL